MKKLGERINEVKFVLRKEILCITNVFTPQGGLDEHIQKNILEKN